MEQTLASLARHLDGQVIGDGSTVIKAINDIETVREGGLTFAEDQRHLTAAIATKAAGIIVPLDVRELDGRPGIRVKSPRLAFAMAFSCIIHAVAGGVLQRSARGASGRRHRGGRVRRPVRSARHRHELAYRLRDHRRVELDRPMSSCTG
jgi:UDP-3-O-[3-hydroxymyristoyl] glucosamine N-acyltransferase